MCSEQASFFCTTLPFYNTLHSQVEILSSVFLATCCKTALTTNSIHPSSSRSWLHKHMYQTCLKCPHRLFDVRTRKQKSALPPRHMAMPIRWVHRSRKRPQRPPHRFRHRPSNMIRGLHIKLDRISQRLEEHSTKMIQPITKPSHFWAVILFASPSDAPWASPLPVMEPRDIPAASTNTKMDQEMIERLGQQRNRGIYLLHEGD
ncbi:hypothetical protein BKA67DRAFT_324448 [Truncatella angustata]|uniref:Uncharacterized protein n=1 Tax=Truncatella angustata TaxID=152316 RepID=A0A9P8UK48_9PEZI|nr:uncharacterized protein BKA67DRAFT_324448 [Truncatella angustata]KAH6653564.1 hypothetical protein BKA67DRAFT_324448 [Truncatella angustata]